MPTNSSRYLDEAKLKLAEHTRQIAGLTSEIAQDKSEFAREKSETQRKERELERLKIELRRKELEIREEEDRMRLLNSDKLEDTNNVGRYGRLAAEESAAERRKAADIKNTSDKKAGTKFF